MISRILSLVILVPIAIVLVVFCVANRAPVEVSLDPIGTMPQLSLQAPLFLMLMGCLILGVVMGGFATWLTQAHYRRKSWKRKYEVERLRREAEESRSRVKELTEEREKAAYATGTPGETRGLAKAPPPPLLSSSAA